MRTVAATKKYVQASMVRAMSIAIELVGPLISSDVPVAPLAAGAPKNWATVDSSAKTAAATGTMP